MRAMVSTLLRVAVLSSLLVSTLRAAELPPVERLQEQMDTPATVVAVHEPHLSVGDLRVAIEYVGYPAVEVLARIFGSDWHEQAKTVELRALDGYVSRIDVGRFLKETAFLVFARNDRAPFTIDNIRQNQTDVPLGPYYLVWDNIASPGLMAEGAQNWPYQVQQVNLVSLSDSALLPDGLAAEFHEGAELVRTYCLQCHKVNGFGGEKHPFNLAAIVRAHSEATFIRWILALRPSGRTRRCRRSPIACPKTSAGASRRPRSTTSWQCRSFNSRRPPPLAILRV